jgi:hypothetical protein
MAEKVSMDSGAPARVAKSSKVSVLRGSSGAGVDVNSPLVILR